MKNDIERPNKLNSDDPHPKLSSPRPVLELLQMVLGCVIAGVTFNIVLRSNGIACGGVVGLSLLASEKTGLEPAYLQWTLNILILLAAFKVLGKQFAFRSLVGMLTLPLVVFLTRNWAPLTDDFVLAALSGGAGLGMGLSLIHI